MHFVGLEFGFKVRVLVGVGVELGFGLCLVHDLRLELALRLRLIGLLHLMCITFCHLLIS